MCFPAQIACSHGIFVPGDVAKAMREYEQSVDLMPQHQIAVYTLAQCLVHRKLYSRAMKLLEKSPKHMRREPEAQQVLDKH